MEIARRELQVATGVAVAGEPPLQLAATIYAPPVGILRRPALALFCIPGGGMNRGYFDLVTANGDTRASFARQLCAEGAIVVTLDPPGIGGSDHPQDGYALTPELIAESLGAASDAMLAQLREGTVLPELPPLPDVQGVGVGHSMGGMLTILLQAQHPRHAAIVVLGFSTAGLPQYLRPKAQALIGDALAIRAQLPTLAREAFGGESYPRPPKAQGSAQLYGSAAAEADVVAALKPVADGLLPLPAQLAIFPGNVAAEAALIKVPVFIGVGERDMTGDPEHLPQNFPSSSELRLCVLPETGHAHFLFPARRQLFEQLGEWLETLRYVEAPG